MKVINYVPVNARLYDVRTGGKSIAKITKRGRETFLTPRANRSFSVEELAMISCFMDEFCW
jgi:hypothetical protein